MTTLSGREHYAQLLPLDGDRALLPAVAVGEVLNMERVELSAGAPNWYIGIKRWGGRELPIVSLEGVCGRPIPPRSSRTRLVVVRTPAGGVGMAIVCQGQPHLAPVNQVALQPAELTAVDPTEFVLARVRIANISAMVPDIEAIEEKLDDARQAALANNLPGWQPAR